MGVNTGERAKLAVIPDQSPPGPPSGIGCDNQSSGLLACASENNTVRPYCAVPCTMSYVYPPLWHERPSFS